MPDQQGIRAFIPKREKTMYERTYRGVSRLEKEYFLALCREQNLRDAFDVRKERDQPGAGDTFTIAVSGRETYQAMQRVFDAANG